MLLQLAEELLPEDRLPFFIARVTRRNKRQRLRIGRHKLRKLYKETKNTYGVGAWFCEHKNRIIKDSINKSAIRKNCNRRFRRRYNNGRYEEVASGSSYKKHEDYWWEIW